MLGARLFGGLAVEVDGRPIGPIAGLKPRSLLAWLLLHPGLHPRARLAGRFWPDVLDTSARASLRSALWTVRAALDEAGGGAYLRADRTGGRHRPGPAPARSTPRSSTGWPRPATRRRCSGPWRWPTARCWPTWPTSGRWPPRTTTASASIGVLERLADAAEGRGDAAAAIAWTRRALEHDRLRESAHRALMRRLAAAGERAGALEAYRRCRAVLAAELGLAPSAETRALAESLRAGDPTAGTAAAAGPAGPAARRSAASPAAAAELEALVGAWEGARAGRGGVALVAGEAGIGKTRLVAEAGSRALAEGARVALGGALELDGGPPFAAWSEALRELIPAVPPPPAAAGWPADLARLCPGRRGELGAGRGPGRGPARPRAGAPVRGRRRPGRLGHAGPPAAHPAGGPPPRRPGQPGAPGLRGPPPARPAGADRRHPARGGRAARSSRAPSTRCAAATRCGWSSGSGRWPRTTCAALVRAAAPGLDRDARERGGGRVGGQPAAGRRGRPRGGRRPGSGRGARAARCAGPLGALPGPARLLVELAAAAGRPLAPGEAAALVGRGRPAGRARRGLGRRPARPGGRAPRAVRARAGARGLLRRARARPGGRGSTAGWPRPWPTARDAPRPRSPAICGWPATTPAPGAIWRPRRRRRARWGPSTRPRPRCGRRSSWPGPTTPPRPSSGSPWPRSRPGAGGARTWTAPSRPRWPAIGPRGDLRGEAAAWEARGRWLRTTAVLPARVPGRLRERARRARARRHRRPRAAGAGHGRRGLGRGDGRRPGARGGAHRRGRVRARGGGGHAAGGRARDGPGRRADPRRPVRGGRGPVGAGRVPRPRRRPARPGRRRLGQRRLGRGLPRRLPARARPGRPRGRPGRPRPGPSSRPSPTPRAPTRWPASAGAPRRGRPRASSSP